MGVVLRGPPAVDKTCPWRKKKRMEPLIYPKNLILRCRTNKGIAASRDDHTQKTFGLAADPS